MTEVLATLQDPCGGRWLELLSRAVMLVQGMVFAGIDVSRNIVGYGPQ